MSPMNKVVLVAVLVVFLERTAALTEETAGLRSMKKRSFEEETLQSIENLDRILHAPHEKLHEILRTLPGGKLLFPPPAHDFASNPVNSLFKAIGLKSDIKKVIVLSHLAKKTALLDALGDAVTEVPLDIVTAGTELPTEVVTAVAEKLKVLNLLVGAAMPTTTPDPLAETTILPEVIPAIAPIVVPAPPAPVPIVAAPLPPVVPVLPPQPPLPVLATPVVVA